jgi:hypothetical protein
MPRNRSIVGLALALCLVGGCAGSSEEDGAVVRGSVGGEQGTKPGELTAPVLEDVIAVAKVLRVRWSATALCDEVEGERRTDKETFAQAFTVPGTDSEYVDEGAHEDQAYTYRLRCLVGDETSSWSNTRTANPLEE